HRGPGLRVPTVTSPLSFYSVLVVQTHVEPNRRVEGPKLLKTQPGEFVVESFAIRSRREIPIPDSPLRDRSCDAMDMLTHAMLTFGRAVFPVKILAGHYVGCKLTPELRDFTILLLKDGSALLIPNRCAAAIPF